MNKFLPIVLSFLLSATLLFSIGCKKTEKTAEEATSVKEATVPPRNWLQEK